MSAQKSASQSLIKPAAFQTPTKSLCSALGGEDTPNKYLHKQQPMGLAPSRFGPGGSLYSPQFGRQLAHADPAACKDGKKSLNQKVVGLKAAAASGPQNLERRSQVSCHSKYSTPRVGSADAES